MKKIVLVTTVLLTFILIATLIGCSSNKQNTQQNTPTPTPAPSNTGTTTTGKTFTLNELKTYNGQNGKLAYVAVNGTVYDVTNARRWNSGSHEGHTAGVDLTGQMGDSPHGNSVLQELKAVGTLKK